MGFTPFEELSGSPILDFQSGRQHAIRQAKVPWDRIEDLVEFLLPSGSFGPPRSFPDIPNLVVKSVHFEPFQGQGEPTTNSSSDLDYDTVNTSSNAKVTIEYEPDVFTDDPEEPQVVLQHHWSAGGEFLLLDSQGLEWVTGTTKFVSDDVKAGLIIPTIEHRITWSQVVNPPFGAIRTRIGRVNNVAVNYGTGTIAAETLLFLGAELQRDLTSDGLLSWQITYLFSERNVPSNESGETTGGWNHFYRSEDSDNNARVDGLNGFYRLRRKVSGDPIYGLTNMDLLFV